MDNKIVEVFIPGPAGRLEAKYYRSNKSTSPIALVLQPHPQYGGTMNNKVVVDIFHTFMENGFSVCRVNFRGVGKSDGEFDNGQGELADAAAALDWLERENFDNSQCWVSGFSFGMFGFLDYWMFGFLDYWFLGASLSKVRTEFQKSKKPNIQ